MHVQVFSMSHGQIGTGLTMCTREDTQAIQQLLRKHSLLIPGNYNADDPYDFITYLHAAKTNGHEFKTLFDRNLISPLVQLAKGNALPKDAGSAKVFQLSAANLAFCILAEIFVEPAMALYEYASSTSHAEAASDHRYFRIADNVDPQCYIDIALGRINRLPLRHLHDLQADSMIALEAVREANFERPLNLWKPQYLYVLKTVDLLRSGLNRRAAAEALLQWQADDAFYNATASLFCLTAMSHHPPKAGMIKDVYNKSISAVQKGIRNAAWDICLVFQWGKWVREGGANSWALSSNDVALRVIAQTLFVGAEESSEKRLYEFLREHWDVRDGSGIFDSYLSRSGEAQIGTQTRTQAVERAFSKIDESILELENSLGISMPPNKQAL